MKTLEEIFDNYTIDKTTNCWNWNRAIDSSGYGAVKYCGKKHNVHRLVWMLLHDNLEKGICVCHKCDNRKCINPDHLFIGTQSDNMKDCVNKGRYFSNVIRGEKNSWSKLSSKQVIEIRQLKESKKISNKEIAKQYKVGYTAISKIIRGENWKHI